MMRELAVTECGDEGETLANEVAACEMVPYMVHCSRCSQGGECEESRHIVSMDQRTEDVVRHWGQGLGMVKGK